MGRAKAEDIGDHIRYPVSWTQPHGPYHLHRRPRADKKLHQQARPLALFVLRQHIARVVSQVVLWPNG